MFGPVLHHDGLSRPLAAPRLRVLNLGVGVQSSTLALMAERGELGPKPDCAIFADTMSEPKAVYRYLEWLEPQLSYPVYRISKGSLRQQLADAAAGIRAAHDRPPLFVLNSETGKVGFTKRQCTRDYKILPIKAKVRELLGMKKGQSARNFLGLKRNEQIVPVVEQWIGISTDEIVRLKRSDYPLIQLRHPLVEARMSRKDCERWLEERQYPIPAKSACVFCTYHDNAEWRRLKGDDPESWEEACVVDDGLRAAGRHKNMRGDFYLHRTLKPLREVDLSEPDVPGFDFANECEGMCGV